MITNRFAIVLIILIGLLLAGCRTANTPDEPQIFMTIPQNMAGGVDATWTVTWDAFGTPPYTIAMTMGGGTTADVAGGTAATSPFSQTFTMVNASTTAAATYTYTVTITDAAAATLTATDTYTVGATTVTNNDPSIDNAVFANGVLTVTVSDPDNDTLTVTITEPTGLSADATSVTAVSGVAEFAIAPDDILAGASGDTTITVDDGNGGTDSMTYTLTVAAISIPADTLAAIPLATAATTDDTVTIVVVSGTFANPFRYMNGCGITMEEGPDYVAGTFNIGAPGGAQKDFDGIWATMDPVPDGVLMPDDVMLQAIDIGGGLIRYDFNVTPIGGSDITTGGVLFNVGLSFDDPGTYTFGIQEFNLVKRTYYSDGDATDYNWGDISNDYTGVPNSIVVTAP
ncbi:hypothetical protein JW859_03195 [bacterium]|nr:hypothetical protein [bacterium]